MFGKWICKPTVGALCGVILGRVGIPAEVDPREAEVLTEEFILRQRETMPDFLRMPFELLTFLFSLHALIRRGAWFHRLANDRQAAHLESWRESRISYCRDFVRFHESLAIVLLYSLPSGTLTAEARHDAPQANCASLL